MQKNIALIQDIETAAAAIGIAPSTLGERAGQGGRFYTRLKDGCRVWPDTADKVRLWIAHNTPHQSLQDGPSVVIFQHGEKTVNQMETIATPPGLSPASIAET